MLGLRSCRSATFINLKTQDTISIHSTFTADFTGRGINGKSSSILITRCTDTHTHTHIHTCCAHSSSQVCEKRAQDCSWWHKRRRCREVTPPVTTVTLLDSRLTTRSSRPADKALSDSLSLFLSLSPPFTPATWSCAKGLRKARLGTNIVRDRDIARGVCWMECDREKAVVEGGTEARDGPGKRGRERSG